MRFKFVLATLFVQVLHCSLGSVQSQTVTPDPPAAADVQSPASEINPEIWPETKGPIAVDPALEKRIDGLLEKMTLRQKVGQIIQGDIGSITPADIKEYPLGSILNGGNSAPGGDNRSGPEKWLALADEFYKATKECDLGGGPFIPMFWGTDAVHGTTTFPVPRFFHTTSG